MKQKIVNNLQSSMKLEKRIVLYIALVVIIFGLLISSWLILSNERQIVDREIENISLLTENITEKYNHYFIDRFKLGKHLNKSLTMRILADEKPPGQIYQPGRIERNEDGSVRIDDNNSGAFLSSNSEITEEFLKHYWFSKRSFELLGDIAQSHFYNFYFISDYNFIRVKPKQWALETEADHDFSQDIFFNTGDPQNNPEKKARWTPIYYDSILKHWMTSLIVPIYEGDEFIGVTGSDLFLDTIFQNVMTLKQEHHLFDIFIFDPNYSLLVHPGHKDYILSKTGEMNTLLNIDDLNDPLLDKIISVIDQEPKAFNRNLEFKQNSDKHYFHARKISSTDWTIVIHISRSDILRKFNTFVLKIILLSLVLAVIIIFILRTYLKHLILKRLTILGNAVKNISEGSLDTPLRVIREDEIGILEKGFINMQRSIKNQFEELKMAEQELRESEAKYRKYINNAPDGIFIADETSGYVMVNKAASQITGYSEKELLQKKIPDLISPDFLEIAEQHFHSTVTEGKASAEIAFITKSGEKRFLRVDSVKISDKRFLGFANDITEKKQSEMELENYKNNLEELVKERTSELEEKNKKLEEFNKLFVGREFRIKELKDKLEKLGKEVQK